ncbi:MAG: aldehyde ferredoxin oxidoreductase C-terminal domain-containing protein, partial [Firmicutes bacterium]|nr:aldehyde ferredoxin oxidoreductase C-terminal domain-containing protein [Bacillota bacterium]
MEAHEQGLWDNGLEFGRTEAISQLWEDIAFRRGVGDDLAEGSRWLSEKYGGQEFAAHAKGMELAAYEPRRSVGLGLGYATSNRGGCHLNGGYMVIMEGLGLSMDAQTPHAKADTTVMFQDLMECISATGQCLFTSYAFFPFPVLKYPQAWFTRLVNRILPLAGPVIRIINMYPEIACIHLPIIFNQTRAMEYATGMNMKFGTYIKAGKRGFVLERLINTKLGITSADDKLPKRFTDVPQVDGNERTKVPLEKMKKVYYDARGWDENGIPTKKILRKLKLDTLAVTAMTARGPLWEGPDPGTATAAGTGTDKEVASHGNH